MDVEKKVKAYHEITREIARLEARKKELSIEILTLLPEDKKSLPFGEYIVKKFQTFSIKTTLENARLFDAVKTEEVVDRAKIKSLFRQGCKIPDVTANYYIQVTRKLSGAACDEKGLSCDPRGFI